MKMKWIKQRTNERKRYRFFFVCLFEQKFIHSTAKLINNYLIKNKKQKLFWDKKTRKFYTIRWLLLMVVVVAWWWWHSFWIISFQFISMVMAGLPCFVNLLFFCFLVSKFLLFWIHFQIKKNKREILSLFFTHAHTHTHIRHWTRFFFYVSNIIQQYYYYYWLINSPSYYYL